MQPEQFSTPHGSAEIQAKLEENKVTWHCNVAGLDHRGEVAIDERGLEPAMRQARLDVVEFLRVRAIKPPEQPAMTPIESLTAPASSDTVSAPEDSDPK